MNEITTSTSRPPSSREVALNRERERAEVTQVVAALMLSFREGGNASEAVAAAYAVSLSDLPVADVVDAAHRFMRGQVPNRNNAFPPSAAELHAEADRLRRDRERHERIMTRGTEY